MVAVDRVRRQTWQVSREDAIFGGSRLYRQAEETAAALIERLSNRDERFGRALDLIDDGQPVSVDGADALWALHSRLRAQAQVISVGISPYHAVPSYLQGAHQCYFGGETVEPWIGPAFKVATALLWPQVHNSDTRVVQAGHDAQAHLVEISGLLDQLAAVGQALVVEPAGRCVVTRDGVELDDRLQRCLEFFARAFGRRGMVMRFTSDSPFRHPAAVLQGVLQVLGGATPSSVAEFADTPLREIPKGERTDFWAGILSRLLVLIAAHDTRRQVDPTPGGLAVLGSAGFVLSEFGIPEKLVPVIQQALQDCFWTPAWLAQRPGPEALRHLVVERPVLRLTREEELFATTASNLVDSLSTFLDASVGTYWDRGGARLSSECFRRLVSLPFEREVIEVFRALGFEAGTVSESGAWTTAVAQQAEHLEGADPPPGEIDVLAHHPCGLAVVAECKALNLPFDARALRNLHGKLSLADDDGFHENLERKRKWAEATLRNHRRLTGDPVGILVVDRLPPFDGLDAPHIVVDAETLQRGLAALLNEYGHI